MEHHPFLGTTPASPPFRAERPDALTPYGQKYRERLKESYLKRKKYVESLVDELFRVPGLPSNVRKNLLQFRNNPCENAPLFERVHVKSFPKKEDAPIKISTALKSLGVTPQEQEGFSRVFDQLFTQSFHLQEERYLLHRAGLDPDALAYEDEATSPALRLGQPHTSSGIRRRTQAPSYHKEVMPWDAYNAPGESLDLDLGVG